jgi:hypothetical protein
MKKNYNKLLITFLSISLIFLTIFLSNYINLHFIDRKISDGLYTKNSNQYSLKDMIFTERMNYQKISDYGWITGIVNYDINIDSETIAEFELLREVDIYVYDKETLVYHTISSNLGKFSLLLPVGNYTIDACKEGFVTHSIDNVNVQVNEVTNIFFTLKKINDYDKGNIIVRLFESVLVDNETYNLPLNGANICISHLNDDGFTKSEYCENITDSVYPYEFFFEVNIGKNKISIKKDGYYPTFRIIDILINQTIEFDFSLKKIKINENGIIYGRVFEQIVYDNNPIILPLSMVSVSVNKNNTIQNPEYKIYNQDYENNKILNNEKNSEKIININNEESIDIEKESISNEIMNNQINIKTYRFCLSDKNGSFIFYSLSNGIYEIWIDKYGYLSKKFEIQLENKSIEINVLLKKSKSSAEIFDYNYKIIPFYASIVTLRDIGGQEKVEIIDNEVIDGGIGCEIFIEDTMINHVILYENNLSIKNFNILKNKELSELTIQIRGDNDLSGRTVIINFEKGFFKNENLNIFYDDFPCINAENLSDVLDSNNDGSNPEYHMIKGSKGIKILMSIPHFSIHTIRISSNVELIDDIGEIATVFVYLFACIIASLIFYGSIYLRKKFR